MRWLVLEWRLEEEQTRSLIPTRDDTTIPDPRDIFYGFFVIIVYDDDDWE